jgi:hypothetical protein
MLGSASRCARLAFDTRNLVEQGQQLRHIVAVRLGQDDGQGDALTISEQMMFASKFASIRWIWAGFGTSAGRSQRRTVDQRPIPIDLVPFLKFGQQRFEEPLPNASSLPTLESTTTRIPRRKIGRGRQGSPGHAGPQHKENAIENTPCFTRFSTGKLHMTVLPGFGDQRLKTLPQVVGQSSLGHANDLQGPSLLPSCSRAELGLRIG